MEVELMVDAFMNLNGTAKIVRLIKVIRYIFVGTLESYLFVTRISPSYVATKNTCSIHCVIKEWHG